MNKGDESYFFLFLLTCEPSINFPRSRQRKQKKWQDEVAARSKRVNTHSLVGVCRIPKRVIILTYPYKYQMEGTKSTETTTTTTPTTSSTTTSTTTTTTTKGEEEGSSNTNDDSCIRLNTGDDHAHLFRACSQASARIHTIDIAQAAKIDEKDMDTALLILENRNLAGDVMHANLSGLEFKRGTFMSKLITKLETCSIDSSFFVSPFASMQLTPSHIFFDTH